MRELSIPAWRGDAARRRRAVIVAVMVALVLTARAGCHRLRAATGPGDRDDPAAGHAPGSLAARQAAEPRFEEIDALLHQARWQPALEQLRAQEPRLAGAERRRGDWLQRLALVEAATGESEQAAWHWGMAQALSEGLFTADELRTFGPAGALLAGRPRRQPGEAPPGMSVEHPGPELQEAVRTQGEVPRLAPGPWDPLQWLRLEVVVDPQGRPRDPLVLSARSETAAYKVLEAMRDWRFEPAKKNGQPVAILYVLSVNPPGKLALDKIIKVSAETAAIDGLLRRQLWSQAAAQAERRWYRLLDETGLGGSQAERAALGLTMAFRALARAGQNPQDQAWARCRWEAAQGLLPGLFELDLSPYGPAGETVAAWRQEDFNAPFQRAGSTHGEIWRVGGAVTKPEKIEAPPPVYPEAARKQRLSGRIIFEAILDTAGRVRHPAILHMDNDGQVALAASALDAVCDWRFRPATLDGKPVKVYYTLTVTFAIQR
jgi:TonB family protein